MCSPAIALGAVSAVAAVGGTVASYSAARSQADAQQQYQQYIYEQNKRVASQSLVREYEATLARQNEESVRANQEIFEITRQAREAAARSYTQSVESGVAGLSVDAMLGDIVRRESEFVARTQQQQRMVFAQIKREQMGLSAQYQNRLISATPGPVTQPSALAAGLSIIGTTAGFFGTEIGDTGVTYFESMFPSSSS